MVIWLGLLFFLAMLGMLLWVYTLHRQMEQLRLVSLQAQKEQDAVMSLIDKLGEKITSKIDLDETLNIITEYIVQATNAESGAIFVADGGESTLSVRVVIGPFPPLHEAVEPAAASARPMTLFEKMRSEKIRFGEGIVGRVAQQAQPLLVTDAEADPRLPRHPTLLNDVRSMILCPLLVRGSVLGVFVVVNKLGEAIFDSRDMALLQALSDQAAVTVDLVKLYDVLAEQQRLEQELSIAHEFQKMLLPEVFPNLPGYELFAFSEAALVVGGDYFDFFEVDERHLGLAIADVSGKGIPGALIMAMVRSVLRAEARGNLSPKEVLRRVNDRIVADTKDNVFTTMTYGILDLREGLFRFVRAGHEPLLVRGEDGREVVPYTPGGIALGLVSGGVFDHTQEAEIELREGELALLYTDGVIEAMDQGSREYGRERLIRRIRTAESPTAESMVRAVVDDIHQFTLGLPQHDDITLLALRRLPRDEMKA